MPNQAPKPLLADIEMPRRLRQRPRYRGYPVPYLAAVSGGIPDFRAPDPQRWQTCVMARVCGLCGQDLQRSAWFIGGPLCAENRVFVDPAMHEDCAEYALRVCPFLAIPKAHYSDHARRPPPASHVTVKVVAPARPERFMLGGTPGWTIIEPSQLIRALPWTALRWWRDGAPEPAP
jgi:hypothetical protein